MSLQSKILIILAHPNIHKSRVNKTLIDYIKHLPFISIHNLYESYPDFYIDVREEQRLLLDHDCIVFQHPFYWYSCPSLMKEWLDVVLERGFAYGQGGTKLQGKTLQMVISTGGPQDSYSPQGYNNFCALDLLKPFEQTANLCKLHFRKPYIIYGAQQVSNEQLSEFGSQYVSLLEGLANGIK